MARPMPSGGTADDVHATTIPPVPGFVPGSPMFDTLIRPQEAAGIAASRGATSACIPTVCPMKNIPLTAAQAIKRVHMAMLGSAHTFPHIPTISTAMPRTSHSAPVTGSPRRSR